MFQSESKKTKKIVFRTATNKAPRGNFLDIELKKN